jgi:FkbM family methyltransferase
MNDMKNLWNGKVPHEEDFNFFKMFEGKGVRFLDCGANCGQSALSFLMVCSDGVVTSFEPNTSYESLLSGIKDMVGANRFNYIMLGLSDNDEAAKLWVPYVCNQPYFQEATMDVTQFEKPWVKERLRSYGGEPRFESIDCKFVRADDLHLVADIVKIDAEGAEMKVLKGMATLISKCRPIFLIENNDWTSVTDYLGTYGYKPFQWIDSAVRNMQGASTNCIYLTQSHLESFKISPV